MRIDHSSFSCFWGTNPEAYRLTYECNLVPVETNYYYGRGIHLHVLAEGRNKGMTPAEVNEMAKKNDGISEKSKKVAEALFSSFKKKYDGDERFKLMYDDGKPLAEVEFDIPIPGSPHRMVGKMDEIITFDGELWVGDTKTANAKASEEKKKTEFNFSYQPIFYVFAARQMGYPVKGMLYRVVTEHVPPRHWIVKSPRTDAQIAQGLVTIHQTCEMIQTLRRTFGKDMAWPHHHNNYPCNNVFNGKSSCEYASICGRHSSEWTTEDLADFKPRCEHLHILQETGRG